MDEKLKQEVETAKDVINQGGIVIYPTETAYGIGGDMRKRKVIDKVYNAKQRPREKGLTAIIDSLETAKKYSNLSQTEEKIIKKFMPGPLTLIAEKKDSVPENLNEDFAFRISSGKIAAELSENTPIIATSANISGRNTSYKVEDISKKLEDKVDFILDAGELQKEPTSTIAEISDDNVNIHREGPIKKQELEKHV